MHIISSISCPQQPTLVILLHCRSLNIKSFLNPPIRIPSSSALWPPDFQIKTFYPFLNSTILYVQPILQCLHMHPNNMKFSVKNVRLLILFLHIPVTCSPLILSRHPFKTPLTLLCYSVSQFMLLYTITFYIYIFKSTHTLSILLGYILHYPPDILSATFRTIFKEPSGWWRMHFMGELCLLLFF